MRRIRLPTPFDREDARLLVGIVTLSLAVLWAGGILGVSVWLFLHLSGLR